MVYAGGMKSIPFLLAALLIRPSGPQAHERLTLGPSGGRLLPLDSPATPNAKFRVMAEGRLEIANAKLKECVTKKKKPAGDHLRRARM